MATSSNRASGFACIFTGGRSMLGLRVLAIAFLSIWLGSLYLAYDIFYHLGINPADGYDGNLAPLSHRIGLSSFVGVSISSVYFFMVFIEHHVVTQILLSDDKQTLRFKTMGWLSWRPIDIPPNDLIKATEQHHASGDSSVTVPRLRLRIRNRKWSLWIQLPGKVVDEKAFRRYVLRK
ncbi:TMEM70/TMEM186/TMEM223 family protein [Aporhodopirellula aestuarii]|uniref:Photosystem I assembly protein Ycf4 n=1 Tax=Aporhodopirellula aestuarii TaxID=2950107 RepID=A0ABT0TXC4_9BACT|nr:hypothetical protein [Aporhodopirellula aestuarii]MCM2369190.1 hypothetical protein [Aporhodopirellula aestuarii]